MGLLSGFFGGESSSSSTAPWAEQQPYLKDIWSEAQSLFNRGAYAGPYTAGIQPWQTAGANAGAGLYNQGQGIAETFGQMGAGLAGNLNTAADYWGSTINGTGYQNPYAQGLNMDLVNQVANNPTVDATIAASLRDPYRMLTEQQLPQNAIDAIASGNSGSSRRGMADAIATRGYEDRAADVGAQVRGAAYDQGLNFARDYAAYQDQGNQRDLYARQAAAQGLQGLGQAGLGYLSDSYDFGQNSAQNLAGWGDYLQGLNQNQIGGQMQQWNAPLDLLKAYAGIIQAGNWGGTTNSSGTSWGLNAGDSSGKGGGLSDLFALFGG